MMSGILENRKITAQGYIPEIQVQLMAKTSSAKLTHENWIQTLEDDTILCYTDGSRLPDGSTGCGITFFFVGDQVARRQSNHMCSIGNQAEVYDAELYACREAL